MFQLLVNLQFITNIKFNKRSSFTHNSHLTYTVSVVVVMVFTWLVLVVVVIAGKFDVVVDCSSDGGLGGVGMMMKKVGTMMPAAC